MNEALWNHRSYREITYNETRSFLASAVVDNDQVIAMNDAITDVGRDVTKDNVNKIYSQLRAIRASSAAKRSLDASVN